MSPFRTGLKYTGRILRPNRTGLKHMNVRVRVRFSNSERPWSSSAFDPRDSVVTRLLAKKHGRRGEKNELLVAFSAFSVEQTRTIPHFTPMLRRQVGILCCTARGLPYLHITGGARMRFVGRKRACWRHAFDS